MTEQENVPSRVSAPTPPEVPKEIKFNYIKGNCFRVVHCDGVIGAPTPHGNITASFFSERLPIPQQTAQRLEPTGQLGADIPERRVQREGVVREVEVELVMSAPVAESIAQWLLLRVEEIKKHMECADTAKKEVGQ